MADNVNNSSDDTSYNTFDFSDILKKISSINSQNSSSNTASDTTNSLDFETIMKIKSIMEALNQEDDPNSNLLYSLKPYLRKSRQVKLDQYVNILKVSKISKMFNQNNNL